MRPVCLCALLVASTAVAAAQTDTNSLTITASRLIAVQPDQLVFAVNVTSGLNTGLDDVLAALAGSGINSANLLSVYSYTDSSNQTTVQWTFTLPVPISEAKTTITVLEGLRQKISANNSGLTLAYRSDGTQVSGQLQSSEQCPLPDLIADARAQAQRLVSGSAGLSVGPILALSDGSTGAVLAQTFVAAAFRSGDFSIGGYTSFLPSPSITFPQNCTVVVKFSLLHY